MKLFQSGLLLLAFAAVGVIGQEEFDEDVVVTADGEEAEVVVEDETVGDDSVLEGDEGLVDDDDEDEGTGASDVDITSYFPEAQVSAGKVSEVLVSVKVHEDAVDTFTFHMVDGGFHYPQDWGYKVQNFSSIRYARELVAGEEATLLFPFMAAELAGGRSYGLQLNLHYVNNKSPPQVFSEAFYNETVEVGENMDNAAAEQFFMLLTIVVFGGLGFLYFASKVTPGKKAAPVAVETGTSAQADASWIPSEHIKGGSTPKTSPKANARRRKAD